MRGRSSGHRTILYSRNQAAGGFGTYMGRTNQTRAGYNGSMTTAKLKDDGATTNGFGVFAYYTGISTYDTYRKSGAKTPNFMYNQQVEWLKNSEYEGYIGGEGTGTNAGFWKYEPLKYWPNEVTDDASKGVDDQENDANTNPAYAKDYSYGGNVSFFAYAPYVPVTQTDDDDIDGALPASGAINYESSTPTKGITAISGNDYSGDPIISYKVAADARDVVDLLWGTYSGTHTNVNNEGNAGVWGTSTNPQPETSPASYAADILAPYGTNADLTKQRTTGTVNIAFKHALAKVGGGATVPTGSASTVNGLLVKLDLDDNKGAETGGSREEFETDYYRTIVTIKTIEISNDLNADGSIGTGVTIGGNTYNETTVKTDGQFNLATGKWTLGTENILLKQTIGTKAETSSDDDNGYYSAELKESLREYLYDATQAGSPTSTTYVANEEPKKYYFKKGVHNGVTEVAQNVFEGDAAPLVFIPGQKPLLRFTIDYVVRTYDENLKLGYSEVEQKITKIVAFKEAVQLNKQYNILMHLGLTGVKFTATVSDWDVANDTPNADTNGDGILDLEVQDVYLPRNVGGLILSFTATPVYNYASKSPTGNATVTSANYYIDATSVAVTESALAYTYAVSDGTTSKPSWLTETDGAFSISSDNSTFTDRSVKVTATKDQLVAEPFVITQYGRTATAIAVTYTSEPSITNLPNTATEGDGINMSPATITAVGYETGSDGKAVSTTVPATDISSEAYELVFIDNVTGLTATWITVGSDKKIKLSAQEASAPARSATMYIRLNGKLVPVKKGDAAVVVSQMAG